MIGGAPVVIAIGFLVGLIDAPLDAFASNTQVAGRISPRLIDLLAALATGTVGAFALVRSDTSDTLAGVAIAISLVLLRGRTLAVVGGLVLVVAVPLGYGTLLVGSNEQLAAQATPPADEWASSNRWVVTTLSAADGQVVITARGPPPPNADVTTLRQAFNDNGLADAGLVVQPVLGGTATCPPNGSTCTPSTE